MPSADPQPDPQTTTLPTGSAARHQLACAARGWFAATAFGQFLFAAFVLLHYYPPTLAGDFAAWNERALITGHVPGDTAGNRQFALHVLAAAAMTLLGLVQLVPAVRRRWPALHRWSGRLFLGLATVLSLGGLWLVWVRGSYLTLNGALAITADGLLILACGFMAWRTASRRDLATHRRWALRTFILASGVWFMRVGYVAWGIATGGSGIARGMAGPFDIVWAWATHLLPLAMLELYFRSERAGSFAQRAMAAALWLAAAIILGGSLGAWLVMWWPHVKG